jgi:Rieske Fe-S protein
MTTSASAYDTTDAASCPGHCGQHADDGSSRRTVLQGAAKACGLALAAPVLAACGSSSSKSSTAPAGNASAPGSPADGGASAPASSSAAGGGSGVSADTADIPVGGGKIFADARIVVTQPTAGDYKAFTATCTHQGCTVADISGGDIVCPCHGSRYSIKDGSVVNGPATRALAAKTVSVQGTKISVS